MTSTTIRGDVRGTNPRDQAGRVRLLSMVWLLLIVLVAIAMVDTGSIAVTRFELANAADKAAFQAASEYKESRDRFKALQAAQDVIQHDVPGAKILADGFEIDPRTGEVKVKLTKRAWSVLAGSLVITRDYTRVSVSATAQPPTL